MTIDQVLHYLEKQKQLIGGDTEVVVSWDDAYAKIERMGVLDTRAVVLSAPTWGSSDFPSDDAVYEDG